MPAKRNVVAKVQINARVDAVSLAKLDALAETERRSRSELIDFAIQEYVSRHAPKKAKDRLERS